MDEIEATVLVTRDQIRDIKLRAQNDGNFYEVIKELYDLEKVCRASDDVHSCAEILITIVQLFFEKSKFEELNENILGFTTRKQLQSKFVFEKLFKECFTILDKISEQKIKIKIMETLITISNGKLYVENEKAQISLKLSKIKRQEGNIEAAIKILEDLKMDTMASVEKKEKLELILEIMDLLIQTKNYGKCLIFAKKISLKSFTEDEESEKMKIRYYRLLISIERLSDYLKTSNYYQAILNTKYMSSQKEESKELFSLAIVYCILAPYDHEQHDMMQRLHKHSLMQEVNYAGLLNEFIKNELIDWYCLKDKFKDCLLSLGIFDHKTEEGLKCWKDLRTRIIEHNIRIFATFYSRAYLNHMSDLLYISVNEIEKHLSNLIINHTICAKIDRLTGIVNFRPCESSGPGATVGNQQNDKLNSWMFNISTFMNLIDNTTYLINKELCNRQFNIAQN